jgi:gliding motility-associated-like protein
MKRIILVILIALFSCELIAQPCLSGWDYRNEIDVDNTLNASAFSDFQVQLTINTSDLITAGKLRADGGDIRFLNSSGTNLEFWIENGTYNKSNTTIWVKCDHLAASTITNIYMFYGNETSATASSGASTFDMFDDFSGTTLNTLNWSNCATNSAVVSSGFLRLTSDGVSNSVITSTSTFTSPVVSEMYVNSISGSSLVMGQVDVNRDGYGIKYEETTLSSVIKLNLFSAESVCVKAEDQTPSANSVSSLSTTGIWSFTWITANSQRLKWPGGDVLRSDAYYNLEYNQPQNMLIGNIEYSGSTTFDWYRVRKYADNDPVLSMGSEVPLAASIAAASDKSSYCENDTIFLSVDSVELATYSWVGPNSFRSNLREPFIVDAKSLQTGNYVVTVYVAGGCSAPRSQISLDVYRTSDGGALTGGTTVCKGVNDGTLTLSSYVGEINEWQLSNSITGPWSTINNVANTLAYSDLVNTTYFRVLVQNNLCSADTSTIDSVIVEEQTVGGTLVGSSSVCVGNNSGEINLYSNVGAVVNWEYSTDNGGTWSNIINSTNSYAYSNLSIPTTYRVKVKNGLCSSDSSNLILIDTLPAPVISFDFDSVCYGIPTVFENTSSFSGDQLNYTWNFGDGSGATIENPSYTYSSSGSFSVLLKGQSNDGCVDSIRKDIYVKASPNLSFTQSNVCLGNTMSFVNSSSILKGSIDTYSWSFGDGSLTDNNESPTYTYALDNSFTVELVGKSDLGCKDVLTKTVEVYADVTTLFSTSDTVCLGTTNYFENTTTSNSTQVSYAWSFGDGSTSTLKDPSYTYLSSGTFYVSLVSTTENGCTSNLLDSVLVVSVPPASFNFSNECFGDSTEFTNTTQDLILYAMNWQFGDGSISSDVHPKHLFTSASTNSVTLTVTSQISSQCTSSIVQSVEVYQDINASYTMSDTVICLGSSHDFMNGTPTNFETLNHAWSFGDGSTSNVESPTYTYVSSGKFYVTLVVSNSSGCSSTYIDSVTVASKPVAAFGFVNECLGDSVAFTNTTPGFLSYDIDWQFDDGSTSLEDNPKHLYGAPGAYDVTLTATSQISSKCTNSIVQTIQVYQSVDASFTMSDTIICFESANDFVNGTPTNFENLDYQWYFGNGASLNAESPSYTYPAIGKYKVTLVASNSDGCSSTYSDSVNVIAVPSATFTTANECFGDTSYFVNTTPDLSSFVISWDFGDNTTSTALDPIHPYLSAGSYHVKLLAVSPAKSACADSSVQTVEIYEAVTAGFTMLDTSVCLGVAAKFTNTSQTNVITALSLTHYWDFGDGNSSSLSSPSYTYSADGTYHVTVTTTTADGCFSIASDSIEIVEVPTPVFTASNECFGDTVSFKNTSLGLSPYTISWDFRDNNLSTDVSPTHLYSNHGVYNVKLTVTSQINTVCEDSLIKSVEIYPGVIAKFSTSDSAYCFGNTISFIDSSESDAITIFYNWTFGDARSSTLSSPSHLYRSVGEYNVLLQTTTNDGCFSEFSDSMQVISAPTPSFTFNTACFGDSTYLVNTTPNSTSLDFMWTLGDGTSGIEINSIHLYDSSGAYTVKLVTELQSYLSCSDSVEQVITVNDTPVADFSVSNACESESVPFSNFSNIDFGSIKDYHWDFGQGDVSIVSSPNNVDYNAGTYNVTLAISSGLGCVDTLVKQLIIFNSPVASFITDNVCEGNTSFFTSTCSVANDTIISYSWNFDDGDTSALETPSHTFLTDTTYQVNLLVQTENSCIHDTTINVEVYDLPIANFSVTEACFGLSNSCNDLSLITNATLLYDWTFDNGETSVIQSPSVLFPTIGMHEINLTVVSSFGCIDSITRFVQVFDLPIANAGKDTTILKRESLILSAQNSSVTDYLWSPISSLNNNLISTPTASPLITTIYCVDIKDINGCENTDCVTITVDQVFNVIVSNVITPDGNDENDTWVIQGIEIYDNVQVSIYDLWGKLIYLSEDYQNDWEGTSNDDQLPDGEYFYVIEDPLTNSVVKGTLTVLRNL